MFPSYKSGVYVPYQVIRRNGFHILHFAIINAVHAERQTLKGPFHLLHRAARQGIQYRIYGIIITVYRNRVGKRIMAGHVSNEKFCGFRFQRILTIIF